MRFSAVVCLLALSVPSLLGQTVEPGTGAPSETIRNQFLSAFQRGSFSRFAELPPTGPVRRHGTTGLIQTFNDATRSGGQLALVRATSTVDDGANSVYQVLTDLYAHYSSVGVATAGYPLQDTSPCPDAACTWAPFSLNHALFAYSSGANDPQNVTVRDPFFTRWQFFGGISRLGPGVSAETAVTSSFGSEATLQSFRNGVLYNVTSGALNGRLVAVRQPVYALYVARNGHAGSLGLPITDEQVLSNGRRRQTFEGGSIEYDENSPPVVRAPVTSVLLRPSTTPVRLSLGQSVTLQAVVTGSDGTELGDRQVTFSTTNSRVAVIEATGLTAVIRAVGSGTARITATAEGKTSLPVEIVVESLCCGVGEGAPTAAIQQAFQLALTRTRTNVRLPGPERVRRAGSGYVQEFQSADPGSTARYLIAISDNSAQAYVLTGAILAKYEELGGSASTLGYPAGDASAAGRQVFEGGALAGTPLQVVSGPILTRWAQSGYESGPAGMPLAAAVAAISFTGEAGYTQSFAGATIAGGPRSAFLVVGPIAERYSAEGGALGSFGFPLGEEAAIDGGRRQEFEGGHIDLIGPTVTAVARERHPAAAANPPAVLPGGRIRLTVSGFPDNAVVRVSVQGQQDFTIATRSGAFTWEALVPANATPGTVVITAVDVNNPAAAAEGRYTIRSLAEARLQMVKVAGDAQSGAPGAVLPNPLRIQLKDDAGAPVSGAAIRFTASPGAAATPETAITDINGLAETRLRLPDTDGVALLTAEGARQVATFSARVEGASILNFPRLTAAPQEPLGPGSATVGEAGALLTAAASMLRYYQAKGAAGSPNGLADVTTVNDFLRRTCITDTRGRQFCDGFLTQSGTAPMVNVWRLPRFVDGAVDIAIERPEIGNIRSVVAGGSPVLLALDLASAQRRGSHFVVATGVASDGSLLIFDPDSRFARTRLSEYLDGFELDGQSWKGQVTGAMRFRPSSGAQAGFAVLSSGPLAVSSRLGECGAAMTWPDQPVGLSGASRPAGTITQRYCEGTAAEYQLELSGEAGGRATIIDLADGGGNTEIAGGGAAAFRVTRPGASLEIAPQATSITARGVVNAATYTADIAPGGLIAIFGSGLARSGRETKVTIGGRAAQIVTALPFQLNVQVPFEVSPGAHTLRVESPWGTAEQDVEVRLTAPAIFRSGTGNGGMIVNQSGELNSPLRPLHRGESVVIYATGLGAVRSEGSLSSVQSAVTVVIRGQELRVLYAGLTPGFAGLYQVNLVIPITIAPGLDVPLTLRQAGVESAPVDISVF